jgi:hypothetical protein
MKSEHANAGVEALVVEALTICSRHDADLGLRLGRILRRAVPPMSAMDGTSIAVALRMFEHLRREPDDFLIGRDRIDACIDEILARQSALRDRIEGDDRLGPSAVPFVPGRPSVLSS